MITIQYPDKKTFHAHSLDDFIRFQRVRRVYRLKNGHLVLEDDAFSEDWSGERKAEKAEEILSGRYLTLLAYEGERVVGLLLLVPTPDKGRMIISSFHVSADCRRKGIGRMLFKAAVDEGRRKGAKALYVSACPSEETIGFYQAMGFEPTVNPIPLYAEDEPLDIQMECPII